MDICLDSGHPVPNVEQVELVGQDTDLSAELSELMVEQMESTEQNEDLVSRLLDKSKFFKKKCNPLEKEHWKEMEKRDLYID